MKYFRVDFFCFQRRIAVLSDEEKRENIPKRHIIDK